MATGTSECKEGRITLLEKGPNDEFTESQTPVSTSSTTMQDAITLTFTPPSDGDYIMYAYACARNDTTLKWTELQLLNDGTSTAYGFERRSFQNTADYTPWFMMVKQTLTATSQTFKIQYRTLSGGTAYLNNMVIIALRADHNRNHEDGLYAESLGDSTTTSNTTYSDKATLTYTPRNTDHVILARQQFTRAITSKNGDAKIIQDSTDLVYNQFRQTQTASDWDIVNMTKGTLSQASTTWKTQFKKSTSGIGTAVAGDSSIMILDVEGRRTN